jgi:hypothetical protein
MVPSDQSVEFFARPAVANLEWEQVVEVRAHRSIDRFRKVLNEVEAQALQESSATGDVEAATHHAYESYLASAAGDLP